MYAYPTISIPQLHSEYKLWMEELDFYKEELKIFEHHLENVAAGKAQSTGMAQVEHFQNVFIRQRDVIDQLKHNLHISEKQLSAFVKRLSRMGLSSIKMDNHTRLRYEMQTFRQLFTEMKTDFRKFEAACK